MITIIIIIYYYGILSAMGGQWSVWHNWFYSSRAVKKIIKDKSCRIYDNNNEQWPALKLLVA
jgi:hypothetical protein